MNDKLLNTGVQDFIIKNTYTDIVSLLLKKDIFEEVSNQELAQQIEARKRSEKKLPTWFGTPNILYPDKLNIEQTSSEITAAYKSKLVSGKSLIDITGGFGVDTYFFSRRVEKVTHCEMNSNLSEMVTHNYPLLGVKNVTFICGDGVEYLLSGHSTYDWIYVDPSRRHDVKGKVFRLADCLPDMTLYLERFLGIAEQLMIKTSPLLDISQGLKELSGVTEIHVVAVNNEVKELLWLVKRNASSQITLKTVNLRDTENQEFSFNLEEESEQEAPLSAPQQYLYEPNAAILKSGGFQVLSIKTGLPKLHKHSHLYTGTHLVDFPGRSFKIDAVVPYQKKELKKQLAGQKAHITTRNFPETVANLRKQFKVLDGGDVYLFFTTNLHQEKIVLFCTKVS